MAKYNGDEKPVTPERNGRLPYDNPDSFVDALEMDFRRINNYLEGKRKERISHAIAWDSRGTTSF